MKRKKRDTVAARDDRYASVVSGCATQIALAAIPLIETQHGIALAYERESRCLSRSAVLAALKRREERERQ